ncbi:siderophore ABC transporter substrate-binding protein [uncultured Schumannella sp.]|uniref:siderophore ABC transporter substrate-binding protein n=1 Tax=uncultured Schumannella sp. TaxID=1195956 RepID=UPI0025FF35B9|nr:ABC transporter substrate-binding protein [uncultured Schumannella sp.]
MPLTDRRRIATPLALVTAAALGLTACSSAAESASIATATITVENAQPAFMASDDASATDQTVVDYSVAAGSVEVPFQPAAVVTFDLATLDTLDALGLGDAVVGIPDALLPDYLAAYADLPKVGTLFEPDFEAVAELDPDLIVTAARSSSAYDELAEIATTIDLTAAAGGAFDPVAALERATQLGEIFGAEDAVAAASADIQTTVDEVSALAPAAGPALLIAVTGGEYGAYAEGSRFGYFFDTLGFTSAVPAAELPGAEGSPHGDVVSNEFIFSVDPEWLLVLDRGAATGEATGDSAAAEVLDNELVGATTAATEGNILFLPASELYLVISGLTAVGNVLDAVLAGLEG